MPIDLIEQNEVIATLSLDSDVEKYHKLYEKFGIFYSSIIRSKKDDKVVGATVNTEVYNELTEGFRRLFTPLYRGFGLVLNNLRPDASFNENPSYIDMTFQEIPIIYTGITKEQYADSKGYIIVDDKGKVIVHGNGSTPKKKEDIITALMILYTPVGFSLDEATKRKMAESDYDAGKYKIIPASKLYGKSKNLQQELTYGIIPEVTVGLLQDFMISKGIKLYSSHDDIEPLLDLLASSIKNGAVRRYDEGNEISYALISTTKLTDSTQFISETYGRLNDKQLAELVDIRKSLDSEELGEASKIILSDEYQKRMEKILHEA